MVFKPGVSGNPNGRPKSSIEFRQAAREHGKAALDFLVTVMADESKQTGDRVKAAGIILDRAYGKATSEGLVISEDERAKIQSGEKLTDAQIVKILSENMQ